MKSYDFVSSFGGSTPPYKSQDIYFTPPLDGLKKYGGSVTLSGRLYSWDFYSGDGYGYGYLQIYGSNDNVTWNYIGYVRPYDSYGHFNSTINGVPLFSRLKIVLVDDTAQGCGSCYSTGVSVAWPGSNITTSVYDFVADEQSVDDAKTAAQQARDAANNVNTIVNSTLTVSAGVVQDSSGTVLSAARAAQQLAQSANNKLDNVQNALTQIQNNQLTIQNINQYLPATLRRISGVNGATATSSGALQVVLDYSNATQYAYQIDDGPWSSWMPISNKVSIPMPRGVHTLTVKVANGPVGQPGPDAVASMQVIGL